MDIKKVMNIHYHYGDSTSLILVTKGIEWMVDDSFRGNYNLQCNF